MASLRVAMVTSHPVQYQVPWLRLLAEAPGIDLTVYYAMIPEAAEQGREFGVAFDWDIPLLGGYQHVLLKNASHKPSVTEFAGCDTPEIGRLLRAGRFDAVIVNGWVVKTCLQALLACRLAGIPCIVRGEVNGLRPRAAWKLAGHRLLLAQYAAVLCIGTRNREYCLARGVPERRLFDTPYCVDNRRFAESAAACRRNQTREALRARFGLDPERSTFLFSGKFVAKKRPGDLIDALRRLSAGNDARAQVLMVGGGPLEPELRAMSVGLPVQFAGFLNQTEIAGAYAASDCLVLPSDFGETWGLVVNEAMACGLPALLSDQVGCAGDLVEPGTTGAVYSCGDVDGLATLLIEYSGRPERLASMGRAACERVQSGFNYDRVLLGVLASLELATAGRRCSAS